MIYRGVLKKLENKNGTSVYLEVNFKYFWYFHLKRFKLVISFWILISSFIYSQRIYFCEGHTESGEPINPTKHLKIKPSGKYLYILLNNDGRLLDNQLFYLFIDKLMDNSFEPFDSKVIRLNEKKSWVAYNYKFTEPGKYLIYFLNSQQKKIVRDTLTVELKNDGNPHRSNVTSAYYDNCELLFCEIVLSGKPIRITNKAYLKKNNGLIYVYLNNGTPLKTSVLVVDVWKKGIHAYDYDQFVETKYYKIDPEWPDAFFKYYFKEKGEYKFSVYNENEVLIGTNYIVVY